VLPHAVSGVGIEGAELRRGLKSLFHLGLKISDVFYMATLFGSLLIKINETVNKNYLVETTKSTILSVSSVNNFSSL
jgi:hypothetical protein